MLCCAQGDQRSHAYVVALRAVCSSDGMTADWYSFTPAFLRDVSTRICNKVRVYCLLQYFQGWSEGGRGRGSAG